MIVGNMSLSVLETELPELHYFDYYYNKQGIEKGSLSYEELYDLQVKLLLGDQFHLFEFYETNDATMQIIEAIVLVSNIVLYF